MLLSFGCFVDLPQGVESRDGDAGDGDGEPIGDGWDFPDGDFSDGPGDGGLESAGDYRWRANVPDGPVEEGPMDFELRCVDHADIEGDCTFFCSLDGAPEAPCAGRHEVEWVGVHGGYAFYEHELCVRALPKQGGLDTTECARFRVTPYARPFVWLPIAPSAASTFVYVDQHCMQLDENGMPGPARTDCSFRCSLDGAPFSDCGDAETPHDVNVAPGSHVLRVETRGPLELPARHVPQVREVTWTMEADAQPETFEIPNDGAPPFADEELGPRRLDALLDAYAGHVVRCTNRDGQDDRARLLAYVSFAYHLPDRAMDAAEITACTMALASDETPCPRPAAQAYGVLDQGPLRLRLPEACVPMMHFDGPGEPGDYCLTSADCAQSDCEYPRAWDQEPVVGRCVNPLDRVETQPGLWCRARGCGRGLYCDGRTCQPEHDVGEVCEPTFTGLDCRESQTCSDGQCVEASAQVLEPCRFDRDCADGICDPASGSCGP